MTAMDRRDFLKGVSGVSTAGLLGPRVRRAAAEPPPETSRIRLTQTVAICTAPQLVSAELLASEGFSDVQHQDMSRATTGPLTEVASGAADIGITFSGPTIIQIDAGDLVTVLAGVHPGCFELFGTQRVRSLKDLKGKKIAVIGLGSSPHVFLSSMLAHVGLDPVRDQSTRPKSCCWSKDSPTRNTSRQTWPLSSSPWPPARPILACISPPTSSPGSTRAIRS
jgi:NitT/TauT family transport system substrate-binding protein